ncbi:hypothetical protein VTI74DRAFT_9770 [Chaetomium olivicolor]
MRQTSVLWLSNSSPQASRPWQGRSSTANALIGCKRLAATCEGVTSCHQPIALVPKIYDYSRPASLCLQQSPAVSSIRAAILPISSQNSCRHTSDRLQPSHTPRGPLISDNRLIGFGSRV